MRSSLINYNLVVLITLVVCCACRRNVHIVNREYYENGNLKFEEYFEGSDSFPTTAKSFYQDGSLHTLCFVNEKGNANGLYYTYYPDGRLQDSCEYYDGMNIRYVCNELPNLSKCYVMVKGNVSKIHIGDTIIIPHSSKIDFSTFMDGLPFYSSKMYYKSNLKDKYMEVIQNESDLNYPFSFFTDIPSDTLCLYFMFPNDNNQIIVGQTPQIKFNFIVE